LDNKKLNKEEYYNKKDRIGTYLSNKRNSVVIPYINGLLIDIACGDGQLLKLYSGPSHGVDIKDYGNTDYVLNDFSKLPLEANVYDTATIIASLNYFDNPIPVLKEINRILKPSGKLIITMPNSMLMKIWHKIREPWVFHTGYSKKRINKFLNSAGFTLSTHDIFLFGINNIYIAKKTTAL